MKSIILLTACLFQIHACAQLIKVDYYPEQPSDVSYKDYQTGKRSLSKTYKKIKEDNSVLNHSVHYWNTATAYIRMGANPDEIYQLLLMAKQKDTMTFCTVLNMAHELCEGDLNKSRSYRALGERYVKLVKECEGINSSVQSLDEMMEKKESIDLIGLNENLINQLLNMMERDQRYRGGSFSTLKKNWESTKNIRSRSSKRAA